MFKKLAIDWKGTKLFSEEQLEKLRQETAPLKTIDPEGPQYAKMVKLLDSLPQETLTQIAGAKINFLSSLALNRIKR
jgi:hypothetical protein